MVALTWGTGAVGGMMSGGACRRPLTPVIDYRYSSHHKQRGGHGLGQANAQAVRSQGDDVYAPNADSAPDYSRKMYQETTDSPHLGPKSASGVLLRRAAIAAGQSAIPNHHKPGPRRRNAGEEAKSAGVCEWCGGPLSASCLVLAESVPASLDLSLSSSK